MELNLTAIKKMNIWRDNPLVLLLQKPPLFHGVDPLIIHSIISECPVESYNIGDVIISEGDESNGRAYIVVGGHANVLIDWEKIATLGIGDIFGEYALVCGEKRSATVQSTTPLECLILTEDIIHQISDETNNLNDILTDRIIENTEANRGMFRE